MVTPLASIIGSGFLVLGPILDHAYGAYAVLVMLFLCLAAYGFGSAIRYNLRSDTAGTANRPPLIGRLEEVSSWLLSIAFVVSVAYYLNLFGAFSVSLAREAEPVQARLITSAVFALILFVGWTRGFKSLERMEYVAVSVKLAIITGLIVGLVDYFHARVEVGELVLNSPEVTGWPAIALAFGLIITVQGFETSRYLREEYDTETCIRSMRWAQGLTTLIYMAYVGLIVFAFDRGELETSETAIIGLMRIVAPILPVLLVAAALSAQFSAAIADTSGAGGLVSEFTKKRVSARIAYAVLVGTGVFLTWTADVFLLISYASRAFAIYYAAQSLIASLYAYRADDWGRLVVYSIMTCLGCVIFATGVPLEGG